MNKNDHTLSFQSRSHMIIFRVTTPYFLLLFEKMVEHAAIH